MAKKLEIVKRIWSLFPKVKQIFKYFSTIVAFSGSIEMVTFSKKCVYLCPEKENGTATATQGNKTAKPKNTEE